ncbi:MAG: CHC2 zinc finger domain-containing protein [Lawsonibacter sp.]
MGLFDEVKQNVTVRQAAERYGLKPNRSGLIRCIFHNDKSPSMKVDRRYYCFGCGCTGDAIDFTAQLFDIGLKDAAMKLADDFGIPYSGRDRGSPQNRRSVSAKKARADTRRTLAEKTSEMPESLSGLSEPASGMERTVCTKNTDRRMA